MKRLKNTGNIYNLLPWLFTAVFTVSATAQKQTAPENKVTAKKVEAVKPVTSGGPRKKIIFLDFFNESGDKNFKYIEKSIGDSMHLSIRSKYAYDRIEPEIWEAYLKKSGATRNSIADVAFVQKLGKDLGADGVIFGSFHVDKAGILTMDGKILSVIDKEVIAEQKLTSELNSKIFTTTDTMSAYLAEHIRDLFYPSDRGAAWRAAVLPGWGHRYKQRKTWSYIHMGTTGAAVLFTGVSFVLYQVAYNDYKNYSPEHVKTTQGETGLYDEAAARSEFTNKENLAKSRLNLTFIAMGILAAAYGFNILHAWMITPDVGNIGGSQKAGVVTAFHYESRGNVFARNSEDYYRLSLAWRF